MKKLLLLTMLLLPFGVSAQEFLRIEKISFAYSCESNNHSFFSGHQHKWDGRKIPNKVILSNGQYLFPDVLCKTIGIDYWVHDDRDNKIIETNLANFQKISVDSMFIYHVGRLYWVEKITYMGTLTIKSVKVHEVKRETSASLNGDFSYNSFFALFEGIGGGGGSANGTISSSMRGGTKTIVNLIFDNGTYASIEASAEPIWLDAKAGMNVKLYKLRGTKLYELIL